MIKFIKLFFNYFFLILFALLFDCIFNIITLDIFYNLIENILFAIALICPIYFMANAKLNKYYLLISYFFFSFCIYFETIYYYLFKTSFSSSAIFVILDSNIDEANEFLGFYINTPVIIFSFLILLITSFTLLKIKKLNNTNLFYLSLNKLKLSVLFIIILIVLKLTSLIVFNLPYLIIRSSIEYYVESKKLGDYKENKNGDFNKVSRMPIKEKEVYVIIIGESTSRSHLGIYDYYRETTPELKKKKDELLIYKDVISPHAYSVGSLTKILTLGNYENPERIFDGSIIQLINSIGFETYWLSNQRPIGPYESMITKISLSAKNHKFLTTEIARHSKVLDEELLLEFNKVIDNDIDKKVIFIHLMGTHHNYENRYPDTFNKFNDSPVTDFKSEESTAKINHYDNAVLYNDFLISEIINRLDSLDRKSFALYFSDHGEEMFDDINMAGHNEDIYSKRMFDIPFFIWRSQKYKQDKILNYNENRKYMIDNLFHSVADLLDVTANEVDYSLSIFNNSFKERKRIIKDTIDYDSYYK